MTRIIQGDCLEEMKKMAANSIDTVITDPPYGLEFMGKSWDYDVPDIDLWVEVLRVLKSGGTALIFAGSRTQHRMAVNVEDAGFILKDCIMWLYGSGFPKATDISKQLDKGHERKVVGVAGKSGSKRNAMAGDFEGGEYMETKASTPEAQLWNGWKSHGLKPAYEPILVAMKPNDETYAQNALKHGVSGLNIDGGRIEGKPRTTHKGRNYTGNKEGQFLGEGLGQFEAEQPTGRFPANIILDEEAGQMLDEQSGELKSGDVNHNVGFRKGNLYGDSKLVHRKHTGDKGGASRYFKNIMVDEDDCFMIRLNQCGLTLENQKVAITLNGVKKEIEKYSQGVEQFLCGNKKTENFQKDIVSTIKTMIRLMTDLKTLSASLEKSITLITQESEKTIKLLKELSIGTVRDAENIRRLLVFRNVVQELIRDTAKIVLEKNSESGEVPTEKSTTNTIENTARIKYCAKSSKAERGEGNIHPTVKSLKLMQYLVRLTKTPTGGKVLDPFMGSGTTGIACKLEGREFIGIDNEAEYVKIAKARIANTEKPLL